MGRINEVSSSWMELTYRQLGLIWEFDQASWINCRAHSDQLFPSKFCKCTFKQFSSASNRCDDIVVEENCDDDKCRGHCAVRIFQDQIGYHHKLTSLECYAMQNRVCDIFPGFLCGSWEVFRNASPHWTFVHVVEVCMKKSHSFIHPLIFHQHFTFHRILIFHFYGIKRHTVRSN